MYEVTFNLDSLPEGAPVEVDGLGRFENGATYAVSEEEALAFQTKHAVQTFTHDEDTGALLTDVQLGPTLEESFKDVQGIDVKVAEPPKNEKKKGGENDA